jgi:hypothetical protein
MKTKTACGLRRLGTSLTIVAGLAACVAAPPSTSQPVEPPQPIVVVTPAPQPQPQPPPPQPRVSDAERLLSYYEFLLGLNADQLAREQENTMRFYGQHRSEFALLQLVLLRTLPTSTRADRAQASEMLSSYLKETRDQPSELRPLAVMLNNQLAELQRQEAETQAQTTRLREEVRKGEEYKQKLDALIETERKILERSKPARNP